MNSWIAQAEQNMLNYLLSPLFRTHWHDFPDSGHLISMKLYACLRINQPFNTGPDVDSVILWNFENIVVNAIMHQLELYFYFYPKSSCYDRLIAYADRLVYDAIYNVGINSDTSNRYLSYLLPDHK